MGKNAPRLYLVFVTKRLYFNFCSAGIITHQNKGFCSRPLILIFRISSWVIRSLSLSLSLSLSVCVCVCVFKVSLLWNHLGKLPQQCEIRILSTWSHVPLELNYGHLNEEFIVFRNLSVVKLPVTLVILMSFFVDWIIQAKSQFGYKMAVDIPFIISTLNNGIKLNKR